MDALTMEEAQDVVWYVRTHPTSDRGAPSQPSTRLATKEEIQGLVQRVNQ